MLSGKSIVLGVCGGIAAYKSVQISSMLRKLNADVHIVMTENAIKFVSPLTFRTISNNRVISGMFTEPDKWDVEHVSLAKKADIIVVAPATANIIGKAACGIADDFLTTLLMAAGSPVLFVPAMNNVMYENEILKDNLKKLISYGYNIMEPEKGFLACGDTGAGRMPEPESVIDKVTDILNSKKDLSGLKVMVTAGPTIEPIDPVRYITNHSTGKMGYAIAGNAFKRGAKVKLVSGPVSLDKPGNIELFNVTTAVEMLETVKQHYEEADILIFTAAVSDFRCTDISEQKIKKNKSNMKLDLLKNPDIAMEMGKIKKSKIHIGFCAETTDLIDNAKSKLAKKNFNFIVANNIKAEGAGFGADTNIVSIIDREGGVCELPKMSKDKLAGLIMDKVKILLEKQAHM